jgi:hypothetical protein
MEIDPEQAGLVWIDAQRAVIVRWEDEPVLDKLESGVPPKRRAVGSVRRGPARPHGGGRVGGHGTAGRHRELLGQFLGEVAERLADLDVVDVRAAGLQGLRAGHRLCSTPSAPTVGSGCDERHEARSNPPNRPGLDG